MLIQSSNKPKLHHARLQILETQSRMKKKKILAKYKPKQCFTK